MSANWYTGTWFTCADRRSHIAEAEQRHGTCEYLWRHVTEQEADASAGLGEDAGADTPRSELDLDDTSDAASAANAASAARQRVLSSERYEPYASAPVAKYGQAGKGKSGKSGKRKGGKSKLRKSSEEPPEYIRDSDEAEQMKEAETAAAEMAPEVHDAATGEMAAQVEAAQVQAYAINVQAAITEASRQAAASVLQQLMQTSMQVPQQNTVSTVPQPQVPPMPMGPFVFPPGPPVLAMPMSPVPPASRTKQRGPGS